MKILALIIFLFSLNLSANIPALEGNIGSTLDGDEMENIDQYDDRNDEQPEPMPEAYEDLPYENHEQTLSYEYDQYEDLENKIQPVNDDEYAEQSNQLNDWEEE